MAYLFTSESVSEGHPDKLCDRVSDTVLGLFLAEEGTPGCLRDLCYDQSCDYWWRGARL